ncbi:ABC transporter [Plasmodium gonderi]|uniref:ABC transporter n=1 Tax=Plasmodium gonderi TaxID=77519 RepID=A0A1Y1JP42_PLAGO|nr:ABC transporter [Plasmodium gonderi]GAW82173.1 ABC transporter [Plasmodium gonderi]
MGNALRKDKTAQGSSFGTNLTNLTRVYDLFSKCGQGRSKKEGNVKRTDNAGLTMQDEKKKKQKTNFLLRAIADMTKGEKALLAMALLFLAINAYTNLSYPKIMGECVEMKGSSEYSSGLCSGRLSKCNFIGSIFQKNKILKKLFLQKLDNNISGVCFFFPYFICGGIASYFRIFFTNKCIKKVENRLKKQVHNKIITENSENFKSSKSSDYLVNCIFNEIKFSAKELITSITQTLRYTNSIIGGSISMICISPYLTKLCGMVVPTYGFLVLLILKKLKNIKIETSNYEEKQMARLSDSLQKKSVISFFGNECYENSYFSKNLKYMEKLNERYTNCESLFYSFLNIGSNVVICSILCFGKSELSKNNITHGQLVSFIAFSSMLALGIVGILKLKKDMGILHLRLQKIYEIIDFPHEEHQHKMKDLQKKKLINKIENLKNIVSNTHEKSDITTTTSTTSGVEIIPKNIRGCIKFKNVYFAYNNFDSNKRKEVLENINLEIKENEKVAIIGKSGSGKSTLWKLLMREYEYQGDIYIDSYNIKNINKNYFKKCIISVSEQDCSILHRSLYENIVYALLPLTIQNEKELPKIITENAQQGGEILDRIFSLLDSHQVEESIQHFSIEEDKKKEDTSSFPMLQCNPQLISELGENSPIYKDKQEHIKEEEEEEEEEEEKEKKKKKITQHQIGTIDNVNVGRRKDEKSVVSNKKSLPNEKINYELLNDYESDKINLINSTVSVLCEELDLNHFIYSLPEHVHTNIQNNNMSSGQRQRISIIRSLMKDTPIYIFDEITSCLDESNIEKIYNLINTLIPNKTIIYITHSINILKQMDKIILVDQGKITSIGTYHEIKNDPRFMDIFSRSAVSP